jgi:hypothetical protein
MPDGSHHRVIVSEASVERSLDFLRDNAQALGEAKERMVLAARMREHVLALEMKKHDGSAASQEREARASAAYHKAILEEAKAAGAFEQMKALREAASARIECWRSEQANFRSMKL